MLKFCCFFFVFLIKNSFCPKKELEFTNLPFLWKIYRTTNQSCLLFAPLNPNLLSGGDVWSVPDSSLKIKIIYFKSTTVVRFQNIKIKLSESLASKIAMDFWSDPDSRPKTEISLLGRGKTEITWKIKESELESLGSFSSNIPSNLALKSKI